ncbi:MAG: hypothetical protein HQ534_01460 [Armatimonadetes bacterium]|nr:hypothetical protein [Armatimonadota bacterium]
MRIYTDPTIRRMSGRFPGSHLVMLSRSGKLRTDARGYSKITDSANNLLFAQKIKAIATVWQSAHDNYKKDMIDYAVEYNKLIVTETELPVSGFALFVKGCFLSADLTSYNLVTFTIDLFAMLTGEDGGSYDFIDNGTLPNCYRPPANTNIVTGVGIE